jgi:signal transduction histidine kinase/CheY-like chemotaxis protein
MPDASIFIIDDEPGIVKLCKRLLERANYQVDGAVAPEQGLQTLREKQFDLLLVDIRMPGLDGFKVIEQTRQMQPDIAVVIMTGYGTIETAIRALRQGADGLILKPFEEGSALVKVVQEALEERWQKQEVARLRTIRPLLNITEALFSETRSDVLIDLILKAIQNHLRSDHSAIYQRSAGESFISLLRSEGKALPEEHARAKAGIIGRADHWKVPIWINQEGPGDPEFKVLLEEYGFSGLICVPIERGEGALVFMAARNTSEPGFQLVDVEMFGLLARQADVALENSRLYGELRDYVRQIEQSQRALIQAEKMSAVGRLTASIAHEVNNPLQAVQNCLHLSERVELSKEQREDYQALAHEELDRLMNTVQRMLDFYRPGAMQKQKTNVVELMDKVQALLEKQLSEQGITVVKDFEKNLPELRVVSNQIQQVFFNLILNAMEAMKDGGMLTISARVEERHVMIDFQDSGPGVAPAIQKTIFEPFVSSNEDGTGLGLSVSFGILTAHGGGLELVDNHKKGACFRVIIPMEEQK